MRYCLVSILIFSATYGLAADTKKLKIGLVLDKGGRDDKSFNASAYKGATEAEKKYGVTLKVVESSDDSAIEPSLRTFAQKGFDLVVGIGFIMQGPIKKVAAEFPNTKFLLVDSHADQPNVRSVIFAEHEGSYLIGAIAALTTKSKSLGFIGGMDIPLIRRFELAYRAGAEATLKGVKVSSNYVGSSSDAWRNPTKGKELALSQYKKGVDIIFAAAGASALGAFDAAEEMKKLIIGVDSNQNWIKPGRVLTSMLKRIDLAVLETVGSASRNEFKAGKFTMGLAEGGVDFALDEHNRALLSPEVETKANEIKAKILRKEIKVPDYYETQKKSS